MDHTLISNPISECMTKTKTVQELLKDALREAAAKGAPVSSGDVRWLKAIDQLRSSLVGPAKAARQIPKS